MFSISDHRQAERESLPSLLLGELRRFAGGRNSEGLIYPWIHVEDAIGALLLEQQHKAKRDMTEPERELLCRIGLRAGLAGTIEPDLMAKRLQRYFSKTCFQPHLMIGIAGILRDHQTRRQLKADAKRLQISGEPTADWLPGGIDFGVNR